jgi:hypothetical protein
MDSEDLAPRPDLVKRSAAFLVIADDESAWSKDDWAPQRDIVRVERVSDHTVERDLQRHNFTQACLDSYLDSHPLRFLTYTAVSHGHAAHLARRAFATERAFEKLANIFYDD